MSARRTWIPNQHGAWAFLIAPIALAAALTGMHMLDLVVLTSWLCAYCANYFLGIAVKSRARPDAWRVRRTRVLAYGLPAVAGAAYVISEDAASLWIAPVLAVAFAVNILSIRSRNERAWLNDISGIVASAAVGLATVHATGGDVVPALTPVGLMTAYFIGTVFYVKTMIRERGNATVLRASIAWHGACLIAAAITSPWAAVMFAVALARAVLVPGRRVSPKQIGIAEAAITVAMMAALAAR